LPGAIAGAVVEATVQLQLGMSLAKVHVVAVGFVSTKRLRQTWPGRTVPKS